MFNPKTLVQGALRQAPSFLLARPGGIIDGLIVAYCLMGFCCSSSGWISTLLSLAVCVLMSLGIGIALDRSIPKAICVMDPTFVGLQQSEKSIEPKQVAKDGNSSLPQKSQLSRDFSDGERLD